MSRITSKWTNSLQGAFGNTPQIQKAVEGEKLWEKFALNTYDDVINHSTDRKKQIEGADFSIKRNTWSRFYTVDVKSNMNKGNFFIENTNDGWLRNPRKKTDRIVHLEVSSGWICEYDRRDMIDYLNKKDIKSELVRMSCYDVNIQSFVKRYNILKKANQIKKKKAVSHALWEESFWS